MTLVKKPGFIGSVALTGMILGFGGGARAAVINFEDIAVPVGSNSVGGDRVSQGFSLDSSADHTHLVHDTALFAAWNGTTTLQVDDFDGQNVLTLTSSGGGAFSLQSLDIGEGATDFLRANTVRVTGNLSGGGVIFLDIAIDGMADQGGPVTDFQTQLFGSGWGSLSSVTFDALDNVNNANYLLDNIVVGAAAVPEPTTLALLGAGFIALRARRRS